MNIASYADLREAAIEQVEPQRLLFVFAVAELPSDATAEQERRFESREGGALVPVMCVDKTPHELGSFASLVDESRQAGKNWDVVFVGAMPGRGGIAPDGEEAVHALKLMVDAIKRGAIGNLLAFNREGDPVQFFQDNAARQRPAADTSHPPPCK